MDKDTGRRRFRIGVGPLGLSLAAAVVTAAAFAAISLADSGSGGNDDQVSRAAVPGPGAAPGVMMFRDDLSDADRQKLEQFHRCMEDHGAPAPPEPGEFDPSNPPKPPSAADREKVQKAFEACKDELPDQLQKAGPPQLHFGGCAPPPGGPGADERGKDRGGDSGT